MREILTLWKRDIKNEWRNFYQLGGLLAFVSGVSYLIYFFSGSPEIREWNLLYWLTYLFLCFFIGSRTYEEDQTRYRMLIYQLINPFNLFHSKWSFLFIFLTLLNILVLFLFRLFIPTIHVDFLQWILLSILLNLGMSVLIAFSALLNAHARNNTLFLTVLILPLSFPLIGMAFATGLNILEGQSLWSNMSKVQLMLAIDLITCALSFFIVPQLFRT
ncbi:MAG: heme exporter protein CcmB [Saprospiraceae bacterium]